MSDLNIYKSVNTAIASSDLGVDIDNTQAVVEKEAQLSSEEYQMESPLGHIGAIGAVVISAALVSHYARFNRK